jgi:hypothetical protein
MCYRTHDDDASGYFLVINGVVNTIFCCVVNAQYCPISLHVVRNSVRNPLACAVSLTVFCIYARAGRLLLLATGSLLVMIDLDTEGRPVPQHGLFRAFRSATSLGECALLGALALFKQYSLPGSNWCLVARLTVSWRPG